MASYLTTSEADTLAASLPNLAAYLAASGTVKAQALELATERFDTARRYQGRKYDPTGAITGTAQELEFPRLHHESVLASLPYQTSMTVFVWDWDPAASGGAGAAIVPARVKRAVLYEAASIITGTRDETLEAIGRGLTAQSTGALSESYRTGGGDPSEPPALCVEAERASRFYRLRSGAML